MPRLRRPTPPSYESLTLVKTRSHHTRKRDFRLIHSFIHSLIHQFASPVEKEFQLLSKNAQYISQSEHQLGAFSDHIMLFSSVFLLP